MRFFLISDNSDAMNGLRLAGIEGTVARSEADLRQALENAAKQPDIAVLLVTEKSPRPTPRCWTAPVPKVRRCSSLCLPPAAVLPVRIA